MSAPVAPPTVRVRPASVDDARGVAEFMSRRGARRMSASFRRRSSPGCGSSRASSGGRRSSKTTSPTSSSPRSTGGSSAGRRPVTGATTIGRRRGSWRASTSWRRTTVTGAGQLLLDAAIGAGDAYLWMMDDNPRAEAFYLRNGFVRDGSSATSSWRPSHPHRPAGASRRRTAMGGGEGCRDGPAHRRRAPRHRAARRAAAPPFVEIGRSGTLWTREQIVGALAEESADSRLTPQTDEWQFRQLSPELVLVTYRLTTPSRISRHSSLWDVGGTAPRLRFHQGTVVPPASAQ